MENPYLKAEKIGDDLLLQLNKKHNYFTKLERQDLYSRYDWIVTCKGKQVIIEQKVRTSLNYPTIFIEEGKYNYLRSLNKPVWYINYCNNPSDKYYGKCIIFPIHKIDNPQLVEVVIKDKINNQYKMVKRYLLNKNEGYIGSYC